MPETIKHVSQIFQHLSRSRAPRLMCATLFFMLMNAGLAAAIPLSTYRERVRQSMIALDSLQATDENFDDESRLARGMQTVAEVRRLLPPSETVTWGDNSSMVVDNSWLEAALKKYEDLAIQDARSRIVLTEVTERLGALSEALAELESQQAQGVSKDEEKARLEAILRRAEYVKESSEKSALSRLIERFLKWLRSLFPDSGPSLSPGSAGLISKIAQIVVIVLALAVIGFCAWKFLPRLLRGVGQKKKKDKREARVVLGERLEPDQTSADLLAEAEALAREGNLRAAIRKGYIALLCELGDRKVLGLAQHKTNRDYLRAVRHEEQLYREMQLLTNSFENHWYGFIPASMDDWNIFRAHYQQALERQG